MENDEHRAVDVDQDGRDDPFDAALAEARLDDEPFTERRRQRAEAAWQEYLRGEARPLAEVRRGLLRGRGDERSAVA